MDVYLQSLLDSLYGTGGFSKSQLETVNQVASVIIFTIIILVIEKISVFISQKILPRILDKTTSVWSNAMMRSGFLRRAVRIVPAVTAYLVIPVIFIEDGLLTVIVKRMALACIAGISSHIAAGFLDALQIVYQANTEELAKRTPIKGYIQLVKIFLYTIGGCLVVTSIMDVSSLGILSGIGALSAVLMIIFKDLLLGFVSGMQLSSNDMIRIGDTIEMPKFGLFGTVIDITLQSVVVRNWDMKICTVPVYSLISDSFLNWRGINEVDGRLIKRSLYIDVQSIRFLSPDEIEKLSRIPLLSEHIRGSIDEITDYNEKNKASPDDTISERRLTNLGVFRAYTERYIKSLSVASAALPFVIRHLQPEAMGMPMEIYFFCVDKVWQNYENIQSGIFEHLLAIIKEFDLKVSQMPNGMDMRYLAETSRA